MAKKQWEMFTSFQLTLASLNLKPGLSKGTASLAGFHVYAHATAVSWHQGDNKTKHRGMLKTSSKFKIMSISCLWLLRTSFWNYNRKLLLNKYQYLGQNWKWMCNKIYSRSEKTVFAFKVLLDKVNINNKYFLNSS